MDFSGPSLWWCPITDACSYWLGLRLTHSPLGFGERGLEVTWEETVFCVAETVRLVSPIFGQDVLRSCGAVLSRLLFLITGEELLPCEEPRSVYGLGDVGKAEVWCEGLGTTQEECKVLIISGLSETFEEVLTTE